MKYLAIFLFLVISPVILFLSCQSKQGKVIKVTHIYDPLVATNARESFNWLKQVSEKFEKDHSGVSVEMELVKWDEIDTKLMADYQAGIAHDVVWTSPQLIAKHALVGDLMDLTPYLDGSQDDVKDLAWSPVWSSGEVKNQRLGIPLGVHARTVAYRRDLFAKAGWDPDKPPKTLDEILDAAKLMTRDTDGDGKIDIWGLGMFFGFSRAVAEIYFSPLLWHYGGELWDAVTKKATFGSPAGVKAAKFLYDLVYTYRVTPEWSLTGTYDDVILRPFLEGRVAMAWGWGTYWIQPLEEKGMIVGTFPPTPEGHAANGDVFETPTAEKHQYLNAWLVSIHRLSKYKDESYQFIQYLLNPLTLSKFPDAGLPARHSLWQTPEMKTDFYKKWYQTILHGKPMPPTAHYMELSQVISAALQEIMSKTAPIEKTLRQFEEEYNARFAGE
jgi:ABC-type glycerol-3-phosphate transport system substrate-binding protein